MPCDNLQPLCALRLVPLYPAATRSHREQISHSELNGPGVSKESIPVIVGSMCRWPLAERDGEIDVLLSTSPFSGLYKEPRALGPSAFRVWH